MPLCVNLAPFGRRLTNGGDVTIIKVMSKKRPFALVYANEVKGHLRAIDAKYHSAIQSAVETQLLHEPDVETRNRKPLKRPMVWEADWELRIGPDNRFRVFYQVDPESRQVRVLAIGVKDRNRLYFRGEEFKE